MAFHSYAQVIRKLFNAYRFGPPAGVTQPSACPCVDHPVSRLQPSTIRPLRTRFRSGSEPSALSLANDHNSQAHYAKGTPSPHYAAPTACRRMVSGSLSLPFRGPFHLSLTVLVRYRSLGSISPYGMVPVDSTGIPRVPAYSGAAPVSSGFAYGALTRCGAPFHALPLAFQQPLSGPTTPSALCNAGGLGSSPFDRLYWGNRVYFLFLQVLRCFSSLRSPPSI